MKKEGVFFVLILFISLLSITLTTAKECNIDGERVTVTEANRIISMYNQRSLLLNRGALPLISSCDELRDQSTWNTLQEGIESISSSFVDTDKDIENSEEIIMHDANLINGSSLEEIEEALGKMNTLSLGISNCANRIITTPTLCYPTFSSLIKEAETDECDGYGECLGKITTAYSQINLWLPGIEDQPTSFYKVRVGFSYPNENPEKVIGMSVDREANRAYFTPGRGTIPEGGFNAAIYAKATGTNYHDLDGFGIDADGNYHLIGEHSAKDEWTLFSAEDFIIQTTTDPSGYAGSWQVPGNLPPSPDKIFYDSNLYPRVILSFNFVNIAGDDPGDYSDSHEDDSNAINEETGGEETPSNPYFGGVRVFIDPEYSDTTEAERGFKPRYVTPFEDIICEIKVDYDGSLDIDGELVTVDSSGNEVEIFADSFRKTGSEDGYDVYQLNINGWDNGWTSNESNMESLIENGKATCRAKITIDEGVDIIKEREFIVNTCVQIKGSHDAPHKMGYFIEDYSMVEASPQELIVSRKEMIKEAFEEIQPLKKYNSYFTHYAGLAPVKSGLFDENFGFENFEKFYGTSCKEIDFTNRFYYGKNFFKNTKDPSKTISLVLKQGFTIPGKTNIFLKRLDETARTSYPVIIHELGHAFGILSDEEPSNDTVVSYERNCRLNGNTFSPYGCNQLNGCAKILGDSHLGNFLEGLNALGLSINGRDQYRPSFDSIMAYGNSKLFNVISCGYFISEIKKEEISDDHFEECLLFTDNGGIEDTDQCASPFDDF